MIIYNLAVLSSALSVLLAGIFYIRLTWKGGINPVPATWILLVVLTTLSFLMYWESPNKSLTANIAVAASMLNNILVLIGVIGANVRYGTLRVAFDQVQKWCLGAGGVIALFWLVTDQPLLAYILIQLIGIAAYAATVARLWKAEVTTEPYFFWIASLVSNLCAFYPAWVRDDIFSWIFLARATPSTALLIYLIWRIKRRMTAKIRLTTES